MKMRILMGAAIALSASAATAQNDVLVEIGVEIWDNWHTEGPLAGYFGPSTISFELDSTNYQTGSFPTRGYVIDASTFQWSFGNVLTTGLETPQPNGQDVLFTIRDNDPLVDGWFFSYGPDLSTEYWSDEINTGSGANYKLRGETSIDVNTFSSLNIMDNLGYYDWNNAQPSTMWFEFDGGFGQAMDMGWNSFEFSAIPSPASLALLVPGVFMIRRRR